MSKTYPLCLAFLLSLFFNSILFSQPDLTKQTIAYGGQNFPSDATLGDFDDDGLLDILVSNRGGHRSTSQARRTNHISWHKNLGNGEYDKRVIDIDHVNRSEPADMDDDGDLDILYTRYYEGSGDVRSNFAEIGIMVNDGDGNFTKKSISSGISAEPDRFRIKDFNNDGLLDFTMGFTFEEFRVEQVGPDEYEARLTGFVRANKAVHINTGDLEFTSFGLGSEEVFRGGVFVTENSADLNNDGFDDFAVLEWESDGDRPLVHVLIYDPIDGTFSRTFSQRVSNTSTPSFYDKDDDGDLDIVGYFFGDLGGPIVMYNDGTGSFVTEFNLDNGGGSGNSPYTQIDYDNDGDLDEIRTGYSWHENLGNNTFEERIIDDVLKDSNTSFEDADEDGDLDILVVNTDSNSPDHLKVFLWENDGVGNYTIKLLDGNNYWTREVDAIDLDQDGDLDLITTIWVSGKILWYENDGFGNFTEHLIVEDWPDGIQLEVADLDNDGDLDIAAVANISNRFSMFENDGNQNFNEIIISEDVSFVYQIEAEDFNGDGWVDIVLSTTLDDDKNISAWFNDKMGGFNRVLNLNLSGRPQAIESNDFDNDGDMDFIVGGHSLSSIFLYENDGLGNFDVSEISGSVSVSYFSLVDLNGDGQMDFISSSSRNDGKVLGFLNNGGNRFIEFTITSEEFWGPLTAADYDGDGDVDIFVQKDDFDINELRYFENNGDFIFREYVFDADFWYPRDFISEDIDNDGDIDLIGAGVAHGLVLWENAKDIVTTRITPNCPGDQTFLSTGGTIEVVWDEPAATTNCTDGGLQIVQELGPANGSLLDVGTHAVVYSISDACGNTSECIFNIYVEEEVAPAECPDEFADYTFLGEFEGHKYFLSENILDWESASKAACNIGGYLVSLESQEENDFIQSNISQIAFIGLSDAENEGDFLWESKTPITSRITNFTDRNTNVRDFGYIKPWDGSFGLENQWVWKNYIVEVDCDTYQSCKIEADLSLVQCDDNGSPDNPADDVFSFRLLINEFNNGEFWKININGIEYQGEYGVEELFEGIPIFAPGQTITLNIEDASGGCSTQVALPIPEPCPGVVTCPTEIPGYQFLGAFDGHHYFLSDDPTDWITASNYVKGNNGYLVSINSHAENEFIRGRVSEIAFIGLTDYQQEGNLEWVSGEDYVYQREGTCSICSQNTASNDFGSFNFWDGTWGFDNQWVQRRYILEFECESFGSGTINSRSANAMDESVLLFPNPATDKVSLQFYSPTNRMEMFRIFNIQNKLMYEREAAILEGQNQLQFDLTGLANGMYILKSENGMVEKFVVEGRD